MVAMPPHRPAWMPPEQPAGIGRWWARRQGNREAGEHGPGRPEEAGWGRGGVGPKAAGGRGWSGARPEAVGGEQVRPEVGGEGGDGGSGVGPKELGRGWG